MMAAKLTIVDVAWRTGRDCVGIVLVDVPYDGLRAYIGVASGTDPILDAQSVALWGARLSFDEAAAFFPRLRGERERWSPY